MAVAAYASVLSLLRVIDNIQHPSRLCLFPDTQQIDALREKLCFLQDFLEVHSSTTTADEDVEPTVRKIARVTNDAEILIDSYVVDRLHGDDAVRGDLDDEIHRVIRRIDSISAELSAPRAIRRGQEQPRAAPLLPLPDDKFGGGGGGDQPPRNGIVGFDDQLKQVLEKLTGKKRELVVVPIVGMGGIGKTTLARSLFDHPYNLHHFPVRIWLTISQDYSSVEKVLRGLMQDGVEGGDEREVLITKLYQKLFGRRYLIVLDDVWSTQVWYELRRGFPDNGRGSRVIVTTRLSEIADSLDARNSYAHSMKFLDEGKSWELVGEKAFERGGRSLELEAIGRRISKGCKGLPLLLTLIGGLLANSDMSVGFWRNVDENINSFATSVNDEHCLKVLSLSYDHLPIHLKPCFLYMRNYEEDSDVEVAELIKAWVSEGYVKPTRGKTLEEAARKYAEDLVARNMFLVRKRSSSAGRIKICGVHDLLRNLSIRESDKEGLLQFPKTVSVCAFSDERTTAMDKVSARSRFVPAVGFKSRNLPLPTRCRWISLYSSDYIYVRPTLRLVWNLEILDMKKKFNVVLPEELWEMRQLRHVKVGNFKLRNPASAKNDANVLENLQTLTRVANFRFTEDVVGRIRNVRKLGLWYDGEYFLEKDRPRFHLRNLAHLRKLESLLVVFRSAIDLKEAISFPSSLKKLTLEHCKIARWEDLTVIGLLPNLEVLKLCCQSVLGDEWNPNEGEFLRLKYLKLANLDLVDWRFDEAPPFPSLETIVLDDMKHLDAIPRELGDALALSSFYLNYCGESIIDSAKAIVDEQRINGHDGLVVHVQGWNGESYQITAGSYHVQ